MALFMGIDQSYTNTGVVITDDNNNVIKSIVIQSDSEQDEFDRCNGIAQTIVQTAIQFNPDYIAIEGLAFGSRGDATRKLAGLQFVVVTQLRSALNSTIKIISPTTLKKFATESGKAQKQDMLKAIPNSIRTVFEQDFKKTKGLYDIADAYWLSRYVSRLINKD